MSESIKKIITSYNHRGLSLSGSGETTLDGTLYTVLYFSAPASTNCIVLVNEKDGMFQEFVQTMFGGRTNKFFGEL